ncbi:MAG: oligosaccharide flippase family protein [Lachnospiraceae bacterium]|nr:oligosaccharide flippase family protein [Lachnospiraceae bacterium]
MNSNRTQNVARTFVFGVFYRIISILCPFVIRTIIIYKLGNEYVGLTSLFTSVLTILNVSELGIKGAIAFCMYKPVAENDIPAINALMALMRKLYHAIGFFILGMGLLLMPFLDKLISGSYPADMNIYWLYLIYLANTVVSYLGFAYKQTLFEVNQRGDINHKILTCVSLVQYALQIVVLLVFGNYYYYAVMLPIASFFVTVISQRVSRKMYPDIIPKGKVPDKTKKIIRTKVVYLAAHSIACSLTNSIDNIIISTSLGLVTVALYGNYSYISTAVMGILNVAYSAILPSLGNSFYTDTGDRRYEIFSAVQLFSNWLVTWCSVCMLCLYQPFMVLWVGEENLLSFAVVIMVVLFFHMNALSLSMTQTYIQALGLWNKTLPRQIAKSLFNLVLDILLVNRFGVEGIVFASFFAAAFIAFPADIFVVYKYVLNKSPRRGLFKSFGYVIISVLVCVVTYVICEFLSFDGIVGFLVKLCICIIVPNVIMLILFFKTSGFLVLRQHVNSLVHKRLSDWRN